MFQATEALRLRSAKVKVASPDKGPVASCEPDNGQWPAVSQIVASEVEEVRARVSRGHDTLLAQCLVQRPSELSVYCQ